MYYCHKKNKRKIEHNAESIKNNVFVGPSYSNDEIKSFLDINKIHYKFLETKSLLDTTAKLISEDNDVGWYKGKMERGPRSLRNRSILADPRKNGIVKKINESIKQRDFWMPFAPIILSEYQDKLIINDKKLFSPFMTIAFDTINGKEK